MSFSSGIAGLISRRMCTPMVSRELKRLTFTFQLEEAVQTAAKLETKRHLQPNRRATGVAFEEKPGFKVFCHGPWPLASPLASWVVGCTSHCLWACPSVAHCQAESPVSHSLARKTQQKSQNICESHHPLT